MKYFNIQLEVDKAHDLFIHLSKLHHPDSNSDSNGKVFAEMKIEYEEYKILKKHEKYLFHYFSNMIKPKIVIKEVFVPVKNHINNENIDKVVNAVNKLDIVNFKDAMKETNNLIKNVKKMLK
ncbi:MAG: hypothetical protein ACOVNU_03045 [Candidatus Kapaibacteriota bacterium]